MLEGLVATLLNRFLGMYIRNFDPKQLNIGIWSGDVQLRNLELRKEALDQMKLPLNVSEGYLGRLTLQIPWSNLKNKPVKVTIEDVYLLATPKQDSEYDEQDEERRRQALKQEKLESAELVHERTMSGLSEEEQQKQQSFTESLVTKTIYKLRSRIFISVTRILYLPQVILLHLVLRWRSFQQYRQTKTGSQYLSKEMWRLHTNLLSSVH